MRFELETAVWDQEKRTLVAFTVANLNGKITRAAEAMEFDAAGGSGEGGLTTATCWTENNPIARLCHVRL